MIILVYLEEYYLQFFIFLFYICNPICESSSGVEHHLAKVEVAGSNPVFRSEPHYARVVELVDTLDLKSNEQ